MVERLAESAEGIEGGMTFAAAAARVELRPPK